MEIERKFVIETEIDLSSLQYEDIVQGYISLDPEIRARSKGGKYYRTSKSKGDMVREESEKEISKNDIKESVTNLIIKITYYC